MAVPLVVLGNHRDTVRQTVAEIPRFADRMATKAQVHGDDLRGLHVLCVLVLPSDSVGRSGGPG